MLDQILCIEKLQCITIAVKAKVFICFLYIISQNVRYSMVSALRQLHGEVYNTKINGAVSQPSVCCGYGIWNLKVAGSSVEVNLTTALHLNWSNKKIKLCQWME